MKGNRTGSSICMEGNWHSTCCISCGAKIHTMNTSNNLTCLKCMTEAMNRIEAEEDNNTALQDYTEDE